MLAALFKMQQQGTNVSGRRMHNWAVCTQVLQYHLSSQHALQFKLLSTSGVPISVQHVACRFAAYDKARLQRILVCSPRLQRDSCLRSYLLAAVHMHPWLPPPWCWPSAADLSLHVCLALVLLLQVCSVLCLQANNQCS
jgi:hypothetical protein